VQTFVKALRKASEHRSFKASELFKSVQTFARALCFISFKPKELPLRLRGSWLYASFRLLFWLCFARALCFISFKPKELPLRF